MQSRYPTPPCIEQCVDGENWNQSLHFGQSAYSVSNVSDIMAELYQNGPAETGNIFQVV